MLRTRLRAAPGSIACTVVSVVLFSGFGSVSIVPARNNGCVVVGFFRVKRAANASGQGSSTALLATVQGGSHRVGPCRIDPWGPGQPG